MAVEKVVKSQNFACNIQNVAWRICDTSLSQFL